MKKLLTVLGLTAILAGCGSSVEVPPAHVGKIMTKETRTLKKDFLSSNNS